jgi:hypothetical protein
MAALASATASPANSQPATPPTMLPHTPPNQMDLVRAM